MKCRNEKFMSTVGTDQISKNTEVDFDVQRNLPDCQKISAGRYISSEAVNGRFDRFRVPQNQFECMRNDCVNTGTYYNGGAETKYKFKLNATEFAAGVLTFYVLPPASDSATAVVKVSESEAMTNADQYTVTLADMAKGSDGFAAVVVDFTQTPVAVGDGWSKEGDAIYVSISITGAAEGDTVGISTLAMYEDMDDFAVSTHVIMRCVSEIDGSIDLDELEETCFSNGGFDTSELQSVEKTITFKAVTPNFHRLNPMYNKGSLTKAWDKETVEATVKALSGTNYGYVILDDMDQSECGFMSIQALYDCREAQNASDALLERLSIPSKVDMDENHYQLVDNEDGTTTILFNAVHIGRQVLISYPKVVDVAESFYLSEENVNELRTRFTYPKCMSDGSKWRFVYNNVLVTSFPDSISNEADAEIELTLVFKRDKNGHWCDAYRILD